MNKSELLSWLREEDRQWKGFLDQFGSERLDQPGVTGHWSMKDIVAHLAAWNRGMVARFRAAQRGEPEPPPPWPANLQGDDDRLNAWIYETYHGRSVREVLDESDQIFQDLLTAIEALPDNVRIETVKGDMGREYYLVWLGDKRFPAGEFFDHFRDDHEAEIRAWMTRNEKQ